MPHGGDRRQVFKTDNTKITRPLHEHKRGFVMPLSLRDMSLAGVPASSVTLQVGHSAPISSAAIQRHPIFAANRP